MLQAERAACTKTEVQAKHSVFWHCKQAARGAGADGGGGFQWADQGTRRPSSGVRGSHLLKSLPSALQMAKVTGERPLA